MIALLVVVLFWFCPVVIVALNAQKHQMNFWLWGGLTLLLWLFILPVYFIVRSKKIKESKMPKLDDFGTKDELEV